MAVSREAEEFAARLRALKDRAERSYGALARRLNVSASTLHRYCSGEAVPVEYAPVERLARLCGASPQEQVELHRLWILADAARGRAKEAAKARPGVRAEEAGTGTAESGTGTAEGPPAPARPGAAEPGTGEPSTAGSGTAGGSPEGGGREAAGTTGDGDATGARNEDTATTSAGDRAPAGAGDRPPAGSRGAGKGGAGARDGAELDAAVPVPARRPAPWYRRYRWPATAGAAIAVILTVVALDSVSPRSSGGTPAAGTATEGTPDGDRFPSPTGTSAGPGPSASRPGPASARPSERRSGPPSASAGRSGPARAPGGGGRGGGVPGGVPLSWTAGSHVWQNGCDHAYLIAKPKEQVPPPPTEQDAEGWASSLGAVHGRDTYVRITVQGKTSSAVVLEALRVRVVGRSAPVERNVFFMDNGCGGSLTPRSFDVNLDASRPVAAPRSGHDGENAIPAVRFPYRVSVSDPEVLLVTGRTVSCDCRWYLELEWSSGGRTGAVRIDDHGRPFRTSAITGMPEHGYDHVERRWVRG